MIVKNDYTKEIQGLKVTGRWLNWWFLLWALHKVTGVDPGVPLSFLAALLVVCLPICDMLFAPIDRWLEHRLRAYRLRKRMRDDRDTFA